MYFVDREKIEKILSYMETIQAEVKKQGFSSFREKLVLERLTHLTVEAFLDVGNMMIDGFIMRDPGSYDDMIDILLDEKVLPAEEEGAFKQFIQLRKMIVHEYTEVDHTAVAEAWTTYQEALEAFPERIRTYLDQELGPVSAFSKDNTKGEA
ncbi:DUF86 domain-containing protein [Halobacillus litoralis]|uniref:DUF86 domain-containing protein n=1 Tax=Halobacillus litoralis TaxID=45668 RepID=A0A845DTZ4_9BACI|nr:MULTISPECIES: DUF86 domain-containing protein [Halobacillus]MYL21123.1 DUF86 domain-containing protein [Halobacillus litoralis]MYL31341.1 DUF86 domain-containing protein [Halobacillus halophilus]MYL38504.1 DUF86 domain-containing protein [Halobacillus litoralis]